MLNKQWPWGALLLMLPIVGHADISGRVFQDFNANGTFDSQVNFNEIGVANVTVKAFDATGAQVALTNSAADGLYTLTGLSSGKAYRIEFFWSDSSLKPGTGVTSSTSVQFAQDGAANLNLTLNNPINYSQSQVDVVVPVAIVGPTTQAIAVGRDYRSLAALVKFPMTATGKPGDAGYIAPTTVATHEQIGSTSGAAYHRESKSIFVAAYAKRASGFGPGGPGAIYRIAADGVISIQATVPDVGLDLHDFSGNFTQGSYDMGYVPNVSRSSLGDMEISADGQTLYVINLKNNHLYAVSTQTLNTVTDLGEVTRPAYCPTGEFHPFGLGMDETNKLYIGTICLRNSMRPNATVMQYDGVSAYSEVFTITLDFSSAFWYGWSDTLDSFASVTLERQQPLLSDLAFDGKDMILAFRNRQFDASYMPGGSNPSHGQVLKACWTGSTWALESNGVCGNATGSLPNYSVVPDKGPGGGYFFDMRDVLFKLGSQPVINAIGSIAAVPGGNIIATLSDPLDLISGGVRQLNPSNGSASKEYQIFRGSADGSNGGSPGGYFGKTGGLGDIEVLADPAPIEVGNRVWLDSNGNGIQDADEAGLDGIEVVLQCGTDSASTTTSNGGQYYFSSASNAAIMQAGEACVIKVNTTQAILSPYLLTQANADGLSSNDAFTDIRDSDASLNASSAEISFTVGQAGENNHGLDIGFRNPPKADLHLSKTAGVSSVQPGESFSYTLTLTNDGPDVATNVQVKDVLPSRMNYVSDNGGGTYDANTGIWQVGSIAIGAANAKTLTISVTAN